MSTPRAADAWLEADDQRTWPVGANCGIGRSPSNAIVLEDRCVSRRHAVIHRQSVDEYWLVDLGSGNGSYVNGRRVSLPVKLVGGDTVSFGDIALTFRREVEPAESATSRLASKTFIQVKSLECWMLLADIVGSTKLAQAADPETWARQVGAWTGECRQIIELHGGVINKYLGDGFLAIWPTHLEPDEHVAAAINKLIAVRDEHASLPFRVVTHVGAVASGGGQTLGEDNLTGVELILLFRMEKLASSLNLDLMCSEPAHKRLAHRVPLAHAGDHKVPGYLDDDARAFFTHAEHKAEIDA